MSTKRHFITRFDLNGCLKEIITIFVVLLAVLALFVL